MDFEICESRMKIHKKNREYFRAKLLYYRLQANISDTLAVLKQNKARNEPSCGCTISSWMDLSNISQISIVADSRFILDGLARQVGYSLPKELHCYVRLFWRRTKNRFNIVGWTIPLKYVEAYANAIKYTRAG